MKGEASLTAASRDRDLESTDLTFLSAYLTLSLYHNAGYRMHRSGEC